MTTLINEDADLVKKLNAIADSAYMDTFKQLYEKTKKELNNTLAFVELQKGLIESSRINGIYSCLFEIRSVRSYAPSEAHLYLDEAIKLIQGKLNE